MHFFYVIKNDNIIVTYGDHVFQNSDLFTRKCLNIMGLCEMSTNCIEMNIAITS